MKHVLVENLSKSYIDKVLFKDISFAISEQQRIGVIGVNGTGKSTLLKIIAGIETADEGNIVHPSDFRIEYLPQNPEFDAQSTILDQIFLGDTPLMRLLKEYEQALIDIEKNPTNEKYQNQLFSLQQKMDAADAWDMNTQAKAVLTKLGITDFTKKISELSGGQRKRVAMAKALIQPADLFILDEPTNHLDNETIEWLEELLSRYRGAILLVTHDRYFLNRVTNRMIELDQGKLYSYEGNYEMFLEKKAEREEREAAMEKKRQNLLRRELAWLKRGAKARTTKQKARIDRVETIREPITKQKEEQLDMAIGSKRLGKKVMEAKHISKAFEGKLLINDFNYLVLPQDRIGIIGPNGSGKSTLLNILAGRIQPDSGEVEVGQTVKLAYYTQENEEMDQNLRVIEYIKEVAEVIYTADGQSITASQMLERFLFSPKLQYTPIYKLSGGERRRLYLLRVLMEEPNVLFLDEPTNDLDIQTLTILEDYLENFPGTVVTVSHDRYFLDRTCEHLFAFEGHPVIRHFYGNYSDYLDVRKTEKVLEIEEEKKKENKDVHKSQERTKTRARKLSFKEQKEWNEINERIEALEKRSAELKDEIAQAGSDFAKVQPLFEEEQQVTEELEQVIERWAELSELIEEIEQGK
ncbi:ABC-F family ATP-binding cassette domain-containing protein [Anaerobacillus sp. MEB173]|uniref:ABC-F family ATP-binding cassette domain-containing protein n=1 Tax=Anaerobacillus sp. MEB173 TaxID=3383345 RepID=UPI003F91D5D3